MTWAIHEGDCLEIARNLGGIDAVVSDPPYGVSNNTRYTRMKGIAPSSDFMPIHDDDRAFDPSPWLDYPRVVLFGSNYFADRLPVGTTLIWYKRRYPGQSYLSDCEIAWQKGGMGVWLHQHIWHGFDRQSERGEKTLHPTQKPVALMRWVIERLKLPPGATILDPYCGSGSTGVAAIELGYNFIGIEQSRDYCEIARRRIAAAEASRQPALFAAD